MEIRPSQVARSEDRTGQIRFLKIGLLEVAPIEFATPKLSALKLRVAHISILNQHVLPIECRGAKTGKPAIDQFHSHERNAMRANVGEIATCQTNVFPNNGAPLPAGKLNSLQQRTLHSKSADFEVGPLQVPQAFFFNRDGLAVYE